MVAIQRYESPIETLGTVIKRVIRWLAIPRGARQTRAHCQTPTHGPSSAN